MHQAVEHDQRREYANVLRVLSKEFRDVLFTLDDDLETRDLTALERDGIATITGALAAVAGSFILAANLIEQETNRREQAALN